MKTHRLFALLLVAASLAGCSEDFFEQTVTIDLPPHTPALAVTSQLNAGDSVVWAYVSSTVGILDKINPSPIGNATVQLFRDGNLFSILSFDTLRQIYRASLPAPLPDTPNEYELRVAAPGFEAVRAVQFMPSPVAIQAATYQEDGALSQEGDRVDLVTIEWDDPAGIENFYEATFFLYLDSTESFPQYTIAIDPIAENFYEAQYLRDDSFDGKRYKWRIGVNLFASGFPDMKLLMRLRSVSRDRYFFERSLYLSDEARYNPFAEPVIIHTNMEGGDGIFSLGTVSEVFIDL